MKDKILNYSLVVLSLCALALTTMALRREFFPPKQPSQQITRDSRWREFADGGISNGASGAPVTMVIFSDFQCPFCRQLSPEVRQIKAKYGDAVRVLFHHYPLEQLHPYAREAALASECANAKGKFTEMESTLFLNQAKIGQVSWGWFAGQAGLSDTAWISTCVTAKRFAGRVSRDVALGNSVPVEGTPTIFVNDLRLPGVPNYEALDSLVAQQVRSR